MEGVLSGQICIVTGASRGIGLAIATRFKQEGAIVYGLSRTKAEADIEWISCDVTDELSVESAIDQILKRKSHRYIGKQCWHNKRRPPYEDENRRLGSCIEFQSSSAFSSRAVSRIMLKQRSGCILNMSSVVGLHGMVEVTMPPLKPA